MTELKLEFELENAELPIDYDKVILSFMKAAIENFSPDLFDRLYNKRESVMKTYCWTCYLPHAQFTSDTIKLGANKFMLTFSDIGSFLQEEAIDLRLWRLGTLCI